MYDKLEPVRQQLAQERAREAKINANLPPKSLYELLQENEAKKDEYFEKQYAERSALRKLDPTDISHIEQQQQKQKLAELRAKTEEQQQLQQFHERKQQKKQKSQQPILEKLTAPKPNIKLNKITKSTTSKTRPKQNEKLTPTNQEPKNQTSKQGLVADTYGSSDEDEDEDEDEDSDN